MHCSLLAVRNRPVVGLVYGHIIGTRARALAVNSELPRRFAVTKRQRELLS